MRRLNGFLALFLAASLGLALACSDDTETTKPDGKVVQKDSGTDSTSTPTTIDCTKNTCYEYVTDKLLIPIDSTTQEKYALVFKGKTYNALGSILALVAQQGGKDLDLQGEIDQAVCGGKAMVLMRVQAKSLTDDTSTAAQSWVASETACCTSTDDATKCCSEAKTKCFAGTTEFTPHKDSPTDMTFGGKIATGKLALGPAKMKLTLPLTDTSKITVNLKNVLITGTMASDKMTDGVLAGAIPKTDLDTVVVPQIATMVNTVYTDTKTAQKTKDLLKMLFDKDGDGKITSTEVSGNDLIKTFLDGDVDVDGDGTKELSLGIGFTAVKGKIKSN